nr:hypothetical protein [Tanacetum cinerariifolium]
VLEEEIASPIELAKAYMASRPYKAVRSLEKGDSSRLLSYPLNESPLKLPAEPPHKKRAFRTSVPGSDSALAADIVATSTLLGVLEEEIASPIELEKAYMASRPYKVAQRQDLVMHNNVTKIAPKLQMVLWVLKMDSQHQDLEADRKCTRTSYARSPSTFTQKAVRSLEKGDSPRLFSYPLNESPLKLSAEPPHKKRAFRTSVPGSDSALAADIVATSTLPGVSITLALVKPPQKKCAFQMSAPEDDLFEIDDALAADIVATSTLLGVSLTPALVENNKQMFSEVVKVLEQAEPKALKLT